MSERGATRRTDISSEHARALNSGIAASRTLTEALAVDQVELLEHVLPDIDPATRASIREAADVGILRRMTRTGTLLCGALDDTAAAALAHHASDTVRGWYCFAVAAREPQGINTLLNDLRVSADDPHFAVREWAWMAARPQLSADLQRSIEVLVTWTADSSERVRRFACESLRPRGVWATHIAELKQHPELGEPILRPLRADPSRYVQDSVANWINDAAKTRPDWAQQLCAEWEADSGNPATKRIVSRGLRSLVKSPTG
ncbi:DNA alkylation repair protein [Leucobacter musarum]|uniref:DNA alkylation repair protein n=1 Tax=Leucobacter musarum TaxID=1930747 RepID=UPI0006A7CAD3|nr:DNA alkylation repair protein [Leucobacter musarum]